MTATSQQVEQLVKVLVERWEQVSRKITELGEELPEGKFESSPVSGVRACGEVFRHVAFWNEYVAGCLRGEEVSDSANELPAAEYPTKASILNAVRRSSEGVSKALRDGRDSLDVKAVELVMTFLEHTSEHYGQLAVYARFMGVIPPASRGQ